MNDTLLSQSPSLQTYKPLKGTRATGNTEAAEGRAWEAAKDFENMVVSDFIQHMFSGVDESQGLFGGGQGESYFRSMWAQSIAEAGSGKFFKIAETIFPILLKQQEGNSHESAPAA